MSLDNILLIPGLGGASYHPDVVDWQIRIAAEGGTASSGTLAALSTFAESIEAAGLRSKLWRLNVFCGNNLNAALTPFYNSPTTGGSAEGFVIDQNNGPFASGDFVESVGLTSDGSKYLDTGLVPSNIGILQGSIGYDPIDVSALQRWYVSAWQASPLTRCGIVINSTGNLYFGWHGTQAAVNPTAERSGFFLGTRTAANLRTLYKNGVEVASNTNNTPSDSALDDTLVVFARNTDGVIDFVNDCGSRGYCVGDAMDATDAANLSSSWAALQTALGR